jgi:peptidoglycan hydrolase-like protein with peptidoglycan-binding domain
MTTRKRRRPEKRHAGRISRAIAGGAAMIGAAAMRNPVATGGTAAFAVVFSFVAANALWYQPSSHPHPWLDTRDAFRDYATRAMHGVTAPATTYRIERDAQPQETAVKTVREASALTNAVVVVQDNASTTPGAQPQAKSDLVAQIQSNLVRRGLYDGPVDGVIGPKTQAAIMFYQETRGLPETGDPEPAVLDLLKKDNAEFNVIPPDRPADVTGAIASKPAQKPADPVAALIAKTPRAAVPVPPAAIPAVAEKASAKPVQKVAALSAKPQAPVAKPDAGAPSDLVKMIQKGLSNLAYRDVSVDGVAGTQTKEAIRHFEKHYRLPVTGEPNEAVLEKLKKIGAL